MPHRRVKFEWPSDDVFSKMWWRAFSTWDELDYSRRIKTRESDRFRQHTGLEKSKLSLSLRVFYDKYSAGLQTRNCGAHPPLNFRFKITVADNTDTHTQRRCEQESLEYTNTHTKLRISTETGFYIVGQRNGVQFIDWPLGYHDNKIEMRKEVPFSTGAALVAHFHSGFIEKMDD
jgi:hypothetical protein